MFSAEEAYTRTIKNIDSAKKQWIKKEASRVDGLIVKGIENGKFQVSTSLNSVMFDDIAAPLIDVGYKVGRADIPMVSGDNSGNIMLVVNWNKDE